jgi:hypothetical protein
MLSTTVLATISKSTKARLCALAILAVTGLFAGMGVWPTDASAWDFQNLPNGYTQTDIFLPITDTTQGQCIDVKLSYSDGQGIHRVDLGSNCDPGFQAALDSFVNASICTVNPGAGGSACVTTTQQTTTVQATTDPGTTTTDPGTTTTAAAPADTTTPADTTVGGTGAAATPTTSVPTTTTPDCDLDCLTARVTALEALYVQLANRVTAIEDANAAAWQTFHDDLVAGMAPADAALDARSSGLNALYELNS